MALMNGLRHMKRALQSRKANRLDTFPALTPVRFIKDENPAPRLSLFIPNVEKSRMYGGQKTAYRFFAALLDSMQCDARMLVEGTYIKDDIEQVRAQYPDWQIVQAGEISTAPKQIVVLSPRMRKHALPVRKNDYFIFTYWTGAYSLGNYRDFQLQTFGESTKHVYLIQDFEPAFNAWSTSYMLAESTYHHPDTIAVFNSIELREWFELLGYTFDASYSFTPKLDPDIAKHLKDVPVDHTRDKTLIFYGRPYVPRNCFSLVINALNTLLTDHPEVSEKWNILSIGSPICKLKLADGQRLQTAGKMTLDNYATLMHRASIGVSLMCSPHPSYPPLEMAAFGVRTITNSFVTKNLGDIPNITSLESVTIQKLADAIWDLMNSETTKPTKAWPDRYAHYLHYTDFFDNIISAVAHELLR